ncbi:MAG TPA: hypothetical protein VG347_11985 [Verrucomicrobiae bacterium]|nr:hypothetical protein [Verrucomicrobiae bacterium]
MKIQLPHPVRRNQCGMATMVFIILLAIMMILVTAESRALIQLHDELKLTEQQQVKRLNGLSTNAVAIVTSTVIK